MHPTRETSDTNVLREPKFMKSLKLSSRISSLMIAKIMDETLKEMKEIELSVGKGGLSLLIEQLMRTSPTITVQEVMWKSSEPKPLSKDDSRYEEIKRLMETHKPEKVLRLRPGEIRKINDNLIIEMTENGIVIYEVVKE